MKDTVQKLFVILGNKKLHLLVVSLVFIFSGFLDFLSLLLLAPFIEALMQNEISNTFISKALADFGYSSFSSAITFLGILIIFVFSVRAVVTFLVTHMILVFGQQVIERLQVGLMERYQQLSFEIFQNRNSSEYIYDIQTLTEKFQALVENLLRSICGLIISIFIIAFLLTTYPLEFTFLLVAFSTIAVLYRILFFTKLKYFGESVTRGSDLLINAIREGILGFAEIKIYGQEKIFKEEVDRGAKLIARSNRRYQLIFYSPQYIFEAIIVFIIVTFSILLVNSEKDVNVITMIGIFGLAALRLRPTIAQLVQAATHIQYSNVHVKRIYDGWQLPNEASRSKKRKIIGLTRKLNSISFENVCLKKDNKTIVDEINLSIKKGDWIGILGSSGSGKSTLMSAILGLIEPNNGRVRYVSDDQNEELQKSEIFSYFAYVPQDPFVFNASLGENITLGKESLDLNLLKKSLKVSELEELKPRLKMPIGEMGDKISGGQRQRLSIARAIYSDREYLFLDEATSALDEDTERKIMDNLKKWKTSRSIVQITHNTDLTHYFDKLIILKDGKVEYFGKKENVTS